MLMTGVGIGLSHTSIDTGSAHGTRGQYILKGVCGVYGILLVLWRCQDLGTGSRSAGSEGKRKWVGGAVAMDNNVVSLQINTADIMTLNRVDRIVHTPVPVQPVRVCGSQCLSLSKGVY